VRALTPDLEAILVSRFQAGASGFRGRIEIDVPIAGTVGACSYVAEGGGSPTSADIWGDFIDNSHNFHAGGGVPAATVTASGGGLFFSDLTYGTFDNGSQFGMKSNVFADTTIEGRWAIDLGAPVSVCIARLVPPGFGTYDSSGSPSGSNVGLDYSDDGVTWVNAIPAMNATAESVGITARYWSLHNGPWVHAGLGYYPGCDISALCFWTNAVTPPSVGTVAVQPTRISIDKSRKMAAQQMSFEVLNEDGGHSRFPSQDTFLEDMVVRAFEWYGDAANEVLVFTGLTDKLIEHRDPRKVAVTCRSMLKRAIVQTFSTIGPQGAGEAGAIRTAENGVYLGLEASAIVTDIADRMGWPTAKRAILPTSFMVDEYVLPDGTSWAECIAGSDRLTAMTGYELFDDEDGVLHFEPAGKSSAADSDTPQVPDYVFSAGVDLMALDLQGDDYDVKTRVKVTGPLTTNKPAWVETWHTNRLRRPVGLFYDPADPTHLYVLDRSTSKLYKLLQSDRSIVSSVSFAGISYPLGISGDPSDASIVWILNAPWKYTGSTSGNSIKKVRRSDGATLATYAIANGRWTTIKVSASFIWLASWDTDKVHKHSKADGSSIASYTVVYNSVAQINPTGLAIDGTTILAFFYGTSGGNRFLLVDESDPTTVDPTNALGVTSGVVSTAGTNILGGEMDTTTHVDLYACSDDLGLVWKFHLVSPVTNNVSTVAADQELEDLLGLRSQAEPRVHDLHPGDAAHPFEIRRMTLALKLVTSLAQATESAVRQLAQVDRFAQTLDAGIVGNPGIQLRDMIAVVDPPSGLDSTRYWLLDTYRSELDASAGTFVGTVALLPWSAVY
jgi:hypothetical protein